MNSHLMLVKSSLLIILISSFVHASYSTAIGVERNARHQDCQSTINWARQHAGVIDFLLNFEEIMTCAFQETAPSNR
jgi:hypothetical protein